jgi:hypothetical protein
VLPLARARTPQLRRIAGVLLAGAMRELRSAAPVDELMRRRRIGRALATRYSAATFTAPALPVVIALPRRTALAAAAGVLAAFNAHARMHCWINDALSASPTW